MDVSQQTACWSRSRTRLTSIPEVVWVPTEMKLSDRNRGRTCAKIARGMSTLAN